MVTIRRSPYVTCPGPFREVWGPRAKTNLGALPYGHTPITFLLYGIYVQNNLTKFLRVNLILTSYKDALRAYLNANDSITSS